MLCRHKLSSLNLQKILTNNSIRISAFGYENKETYPIYVSKKYFEAKHADLLLIREKN